MKSDLTLDQVRTALGLDPATGILIWTAPQSNRVKIGDRAGVVAANGRRYINLAGEKHLAHRLVWFHFYGVWPSGDVKQKNGDYDDCRIENLVDQTRQETASNRRVNAKSKSGHPGVTWDSKREKWQVHITRDYKQVAFGYYGDLGEAIVARQEAQSMQLAVSATDRASAAHKIVRRRRQRMAWNALQRGGFEIAWTSLDEFCRDIGDLPQTKMTIVPIEASKPIGPNNWRWSLPVDTKYDFRTPQGRSAYGRDHRAANSMAYRDKELRKKFGIGLVEYNEKLDRQTGVCAICERPETMERNGKELWLAVDHDHFTKANRELLCSQCNQALGKFEDRPTLLRRAADYLERHGKSEMAWGKPSVTEITHLPIGQKILMEAAPYG